MRPSPDISGRPRRQAKKAQRRGLLHAENVFSPTTQASGFAAGRNRAGYLDRFLAVSTVRNCLFDCEHLPDSKHKCSPSSSPTARMHAIGAILLWPNQFYAQAKYLPFFCDVTALITNTYIYLKIISLAFYINFGYHSRIVRE